MKKVLFYSSVRDKSLFYTQKFYQFDASILEGIGFQVTFSNQVIDSFLFWRYDIVYAYFYRKSVLVTLFAKIFGRRVYLTGGIDDLDRTHASKRKYDIQIILFKFCYLLADKCIIVSDSDYKNIKQLYKDDKKLSKLVVSEHSIDTLPYKEQCDKKNIMTSIVWMGTVGNVRRKGVDTAIKLFSKMCEDPCYEDYKFIIIGKKGLGTHYLEELIREYGVESKVSIVGELPEADKIAYLKESKFYFQLSEYEGFGMAALEAICALNIVIHSGKGGLNNAIYMDNGILFNIDNDFEEEYKNFIKKIKSYDVVKLQGCINDIMNKYDNTRRKKDLRKIINE